MSYMYKWSFKCPLYSLLHVWAWYKSDDLVLELWTMLIIDVIWLDWMAAGSNFKNRELIQIWQT